MATFLNSSNPYYRDGVGINDFVVGSSIGDTILGLGGADHLQGENGNDTIHGGQENDKIFGGSGHDNLYGDYGSDLLEGGDGDDILNGGHWSGDIYDDVDHGQDTLKGGAGNDYLYGGMGADTLSGGDGADYIQAGMHTGDANWMLDLSNDIIEGGAGDDIVFASGGDDLVSGGLDNDSLFGESGNDILIGDEGADKLNGGTGNDMLSGGSGADTYQFDLDFGDDAVDEYNDGEINQLLLNWLGAAGEVYFTRAGLSADGYDTSLTIQTTQGSVQLLNVFDAQGELSTLDLSAFELIDFTNMPLGNLLDGLELSTTGIGFERLRGTLDDDILVARAGSDAILYGGEGDDTYRLESGFGTVRISEYGNETGNVIEFGSGIVAEDVIFEIKHTSNPTNDLVIKHGEDELTIFSYFQEEVENPELSDIPFGFIEFADGKVIDLTSDRLDYFGTEYTETLQGSSRGDVLHALSGHDTVYSAGGDDIIYGGDGTDHLYGEAGDDQIYGGVGNDQIIGGKGDDVLVGGDWADYFVFHAGDGHDTILDFDAANWGEAIDLSSYQSIVGFGDFRIVSGAPTGDMEIGQSGSDTVIRIDLETSITLENVLATDLSASEFLFS